MSGGTTLGPDIIGACVAFVGVVSLLGYGVFGFVRAYRYTPSDTATVSPLHVWHRWTKWSEPVAAKYSSDSFISMSGVHGWYTMTTDDPPSTPKRTVTYQEQYRHCTVCGLAQMRRV